MAPLGRGGPKSRTPESSLEWVIRFTLGERRSDGRDGLGSIKHRNGRGNDTIP